MPQDNMKESYLQEVLLPWSVVIAPCYEQDIIVGLCNELVVVGNHPQVISNIKVN